MDKKKIITCPSCGVSIDLEKERAYYILEEKYNSLLEKVEVLSKNLENLNKQVSNKIKKNIDEEILG